MENKNVLMKDKVIFNFEIHLEYLKKMYILQQYSSVLAEFAQTE